MKLDFKPDAFPLWYDEHERIRMGGRRMTLEIIGACSKQCDSPEEIACYLRHQAEIDAYLESDDSGLRVWANR